MILFLLLTSQYLFEQNKIQYRSHHWLLHETDHFSIYYYEEEKILLPFAIKVLEETYEKLKKRLNYKERKFEEKIPVILYKSHPDFQETNIILDRIPEGVGGFSEIFKHRIVLPFTGSYSDFRHVLAHELVHIFQYRLLYGKGVDAIKRALASDIPLWFIEGMAEFESLGWDESAETYIKDAVLTNKLFSISQLSRMGGYPIYKQGQSILYYIRKKYGDEKIGEIVSKMRHTNSFEEALSSVLGIGVGRLNTEWEQELKKKYWPIIKEKQYINDFARPIVTHKGFEDLYNYAPAISPEGDKVIYFTDKVGEVQIKVISTLTKEDLGTLVKGGLTSKFESLHLMDGHVDFSQDGNRIVFSAMEKGKDVLYVMDIREKRILDRIDLDLDRIRWPEFSPNGVKIAFSGLKNASSDIYVYDLKSKEVLNITHDIYSDDYPTWFGDSIIFVSDRPEMDLWEYEKKDLYITDLKGKIRKYFSFGKEIIAPQVYNSMVYFISYRDGSKNLYVYKPKEKAIKQLTDIVGSIDGFSISNSGHLSLCVYSNLGWDIYFLDSIEELKEKDPNPPMDFELEEFIPVVMEKEGKGDERAPLMFGVDYLFGALGYYLDYGVYGYGALGLSDMLGNHQIYGVFDNTGDLTESNFYIEYLYLKNRVDFAASVIRQVGYFLLGGGLPAAGDIWNLNGIVIYPFNRFRRIELGLSSYYLGEELWIPLPEYPGWWIRIPSTGLPNFGLMGDISLIHDNAVWGNINPIKGTRGRISFSKSLLKGERYWDISTAYLDFRDYFYLTTGYSLAFRLFLIHSWGRDAELFGIFGIGGSRTVRGYDYYTQTGNSAGLIKMELRLPLIKRLELGFPPISLSGIDGALFSDFGVATYDYKKLKFFTIEENWIRLVDPVMSFGVEFRLNLGIAVLNFDISKRTDLHSIYEGTYYEIYLGLPF
ncbi:MAG: hypothetical protein ABIN61_04110 [candidate division WOR-3 bacterium]